MSDGMNGRREIPTHLEVEDRLVFGLTLRQGIVVLVGLSIGYALYAQAGNLPWPDGGGDLSGHPPLMLRVAIALLPALGAVALAVVQPGGRPLEEWLFALARYAALPKRSVWRPRSCDGNLPHTQLADCTDLGDLAHLRTRAAAREAIEVTGGVDGREPPDVLRRTRAGEHAGEERERHEEGEAS